MSRREQTEARILQALGEQIRATGMAGVGINAVAKRAKVSKELIYRYFEGFPGLMSAWMQKQDFWSSHPDLLGDDESSQRPPVDLILSMLHAQIGALAGNETLMEGRRGAPRARCGLLRRPGRWLDGRGRCPGDDKHHARRGALSDVALKDGGPISWRSIAHQRRLGPFLRCHRTPCPGVSRGLAARVAGDARSVAQAGMRQERRSMKRAADRLIETLVSRHRSSVGPRWPSKRIAALHRLPIRSVLAARCALRCAPVAARSLRHLIGDATLAGHLGHKCT